MHIPKRLLRLAKERALTSFSALAEQTVVEADTRVVKAMTTAAGDDLRELAVVRNFLRGEGRTLRNRMDKHFAAYLERAMETMHSPVRPGLDNISYDTLTLIDDDVVTRQIEVDRLVARLRDAEPISLGRVNLTIALLHDDSDVRERENPFRPYLLARSLYEALRELLWEEGHAKLLFDALSVAMASRLPGFYVGLQEVFEAGGVTARLTARPTAMTRAERDRMAWKRAADQLVGGHLPTTLPTDHPDQAHQARMLPRLQRLRELHGNASGGGGVASKPMDLQDMVWNVFHQPKTARRARDDSAPALPAAIAGRSPLDARLLKLQQDIAAGAAPPEPLELRTSLADLTLEGAERDTVDLVALLFDSMVHDDLLTPSLRQQFLRLYLPFLRAAVMKHALLHEADHPARRLLDRLGSVGIAITADMPCFAALEKEIDTVVSAVLDLFDDDMEMFADAELTLDTHVTALLVEHDARIGPALDAIGEAISSSTRLAGAGAALAGALLPLKVHPNVSEFILGTWARVLSHPGQGSDMSRGLLPELIWSAQEKTSPEDRSKLMRMLPEIVKRVRAGLATIALPEAPSKAAFDKLVAVHMDVLGGKLASGGKLLTLEELQEHFADFEIDPHYVVPPGKEGWVGKFELEAALKRRGLVGTIHAKAAARQAQSSDEDWLLWARPGNGFEIKVEGRFVPALLCAVSKGDSAFLFSMGRADGQVIYLRGPLLEALESGTLRPLEYAPVFDRAVESLMAGAEQLAGKT